jgi:hypothetical protein
MDITAPVLGGLLLWLLPAMAITWWAIGKGMSAVGFAFLAVVCWPVAALVVMLTPRQTSS